MKTHVKAAARLLGKLAAIAPTSALSDLALRGCAGSGRVETVMEQLGAEQFTKFWDAARALSIEEAIHEALVLLEDLASNHF